MLDGAMFWATVLIVAAFYFGGTITGLELAGQFDAALANRFARLSIVLPSLVMFLRDALKVLRR
jgi:hypothetical protein